MASRRGVTGLCSRTPMVLIHHIATAADWAAAQAAGDYRPASLDSEGFVHASTPAQLLATANAYFRGRADLVLLDLDEARLPDVRYEAPAPPPGVMPAPDRAAQRFPHIYGAIPLDAVLAARPWPPGADGRFTLP